jgi:hypothetical protein
VEAQEDSYNKIALATATIMFVAFSFILLIYFLQKTSRLDQLEYDINTVSAGDFTVEINISSKMYNYFLDEHYNTVGFKTKEESGDTYSPALYLKKHLSEEIGRMLTNSL